MYTIYTTFFAWLPAKFQFAVFCLFAFVILFVIFRLIKLVLDVLPFV